MRRTRGAGPAPGCGRRRSGRLAGPASVGGFTLIEVVVAFGLLALALTLLLGALTGASRQIQRANLAGRAALHAQSLLAQVGAGAPLQPGEQDGELDDGRYHWRLEVAPWTDPTLPADGLINPAATRLLEVRLTMHWGEGAADALQWRSLRLAPAQGTPGT